MELLLLLLLLLWRGTISQSSEYRIEVPETVTVQEGLCVSIPCSFYYPQEYRDKEIVHVYWYYTATWKDYLAATNDPGASVHSWALGRFNLTGDPKMNNCSLRITRPQKTDNGKYYFWVKMGNQMHGYKNKKVDVHVTDLTQQPEIHIPKILEAGHQVNLICLVPGSCGEETPITFLWTGTALSTSRFPSQDFHSSKLLFTPQPQDDGTKLTCQVTFKEPSVSKERTIQLNISYPPMKMSILVSWANKRDSELPRNSSTLVALEGDSITLVCAAHSNPPATLSWAWGNQTLNSTQPSSPGKVALELSELRHTATGEYTCQARHHLGLQHHSVRLCVQTLAQKPEVHIPETLESGRQVTLTCLVPGVCKEEHFTYLWFGTTLSSQGSALLNTNSSKLLFTPQPEDHGTNLTCQVTLPKARMKIKRTVQLRVAYPPQNMTISVSGANRTDPELLENTTFLMVLEGDSLTLSCAVTESNPPATLIWTHRNQVLKSSQASNSGVLHLELSKLGPKQGGEYTCLAQHPLGPHQHSVRLCVQTYSCCLNLEEEIGSWPLIFTMLRGVLMGAGFLLTYGLSWLYYTCKVNQPRDTMDESKLINLYSDPLSYGTQDMFKRGSWNNQNCWMKSQ